MGHGLIEDALLPVRKRFWERFEEQRALTPFFKLPWPEATAPESPLSWSEWEGHLLPGTAGRIVFFDGYFSRELSFLPKGCILLSLDEAMKTYGFVLQSRFAKALKEERDPIASLNGAFHGRGAFLYLPPGTILERPIQIVSIFSKECWMAERLQLFMGKGAEATCIQTTLGGGLFTQMVDASLDAGAKLALSLSADLSKEANCFQTVRVSLKRSASFKSFSFSEGSALFRRSLAATLLEEGAEAHVQGLDHLRGANQAHTDVLVEHQAPHCISRQHFKKALQGSARSSFEGKIYVHPQAQKTEAYQLNQNLILSPDAAAHAKPNLEIFADDVKASHGATFSQLNLEELFYFQARGIAAGEAKRLLFKGFCSELVENIAFAPLRERIQARLAQ